MADPQQVLGARVRDALVAAYGADYADADPLIRPSSFADLQSNAALPLAKRLGRAPRDIATEIVCPWTSRTSPSRPRSAAPVSSTSRRTHWIADAAAEVLADPGLACRPPPGPRRSSSTTPRPTSPRRCTSATCAPRSSATPSSGSWSSRATPDQRGPPGRLGNAVRHAPPAPAGRRRRVGQAAMLDPTRTSSTRRRSQFDADADFAERARDRVVNSSRATPGDAASCGPADRLNPGATSARPTSSWG